MKPRRIVVNAQVRALLVELDVLMRKFDDMTARLSAPIFDTDAVSVGADREQVRAQILGLANRLNKASVRAGA